MFGKKKGAANVGSGVMTLIFAAIVILAVGIPVAQDAIDAANLTGIPATIVGYVPTFMALALLVLAARMSGLM